LVAGRCLPCQIVAHPNFGAEIIRHDWQERGLKNELHACVGPAKIWLPSNGGLAHGQWPVFGLATQGSHPNTLQKRKFGASF